MRTQHPKIRDGSALRSRSLRALVAACAGAGAIALAGTAAAQPLDENPPIPDVLLLLDTSGTMELMMDGCNVDTGLYPDGTGGGNCNGTINCVAVGANCPGATAAYCDGVTSRTANRWGTQVAALTGDFLSPTAGGSAYSCLSMPRTPSSAFANEFSYQFASGSVPPYDLNYYLPFHRPAENLTPTTACVFGFQQGPTGWYADTSISHQENPSSSPPTADFQAAAIQGYVYDIATMTPVLTAAGAMTPCSGGFLQDQDGLLNYGVNSIRFGLMTIDSDTLPSTGITFTSDSGNLTFFDTANNGLSNDMTTGMWSYYDGWETGLPPLYTGSTVGRPAGCGEVASSGQIFYEVGARNPAAPPWEGRMMRFPSGATTAPASNNNQIMQAIRVMRPYGANPIAGMMDDAKYYFWKDPQGPSSSATDPLGSCRPQYIILLSHAAPNEDLEPYCQGTANGNIGMCPYDYPEYISAGLASGSYTKGAGVTNAQSETLSGHPVYTFVVGFSVSSGIGDAGTQSCNDILSGPVGSQTIKTGTGFCGTPATNGPSTGTADNPVYATCCELARIANNGGTQVPYFADNQTDLEKAFAAILATILANSTTRATPVLLPQAASSSAGGGPSAALFLSSFTPSNLTAWSGDEQRERYQCSSSGGVWGPQQQAVTPANGDDFQYNLQQSQGTARNVITVEPYPPVTTSLTGFTRNASTNIRPWVNGPSGTTATSLAFDGYTMYDGQESGFSYVTAGSNAISATFNTNGISPDVLFPSGCTYKQPGAASAFSASDCETIALGYALGMALPPTTWNTNLSAFPTRYYTPGSVPATYGPFGGILDSTPAIATPPNALLRDDSYQAYTQSYTTSYTTYNSTREPRHTVLYTATIDGVLHAFGVDYNPADEYTFIGSTHANEGGTNGLQNEMWSFIPPAVLPLLINGVGGGATVLLDGAPVVKDTIYQRTTVGTGTDWHTALVAGFGSASPGYYALDVTDPNFLDRGAAPTTFGPAHASTNSNLPPQLSSSGYLDTNNKPLGPHFLWQLIDTNLFAPTGGTPAITTVSILDPDVTNPSAPTEIGVAILPGGASTPGSTTLGCPRTCKGAACTTPVKKITDASPLGSSPNYELSLKVRQWNASGCPSATLPARGRSLTIVRLDTGEVLRTFTPLTDIPSNFALYSPNGTTPTAATNAAGYTYQGRVTQAEFDSPISGTPVPYPNEVGAIAQRVFVGDQDGTIWRLDLSKPDPNQWFVEPFFDAYNVAVQGSTADDAWAVQRAPVVLAPSVSIARNGGVVLNFGTGDVTSIGTASNQNFVYSVVESPVTDTNDPDNLPAYVNWYWAFLNAGEMVTGPSAVFDGAFYFASYAPASGGGTAGCSPGTANLWGMDYTAAADQHGNPLVTGIPQYGGVSKMINTSGALAQELPQGSAIIPGVTITSTATCAQTGVGTDPATGGPLLSMSNVSPASYQVSALEGTPGKSQGLNAAVAQVSVAMSVHTSTLVDSWASIVE